MAKRSRSTEQQLNAAQQRLDQLRERARREDTRRRVMIGSMLLGRARHDAQAKKRLLRDLDIWLTEWRDRRLFADLGLGPIRGLYGATLHPAAQPPGWAFGKGLPLAVQSDRYGNPITA